jgi:hypothetical protein
MKARTELVNTDTQMNEEPMTPAPQATPRTDELDEALSTISDVLVRYASMRGHSRHLERALLAAERDAARYRWLREPSNLDGPRMLAVSDPDELDAAIDAALAGKQEEGR